MIRKNNTAFGKLILAIGRQWPQIQLCHFLVVPVPSLIHELICTVLLSLSSGDAGEPLPHRAAKL